MFQTSPAWGLVSPRAATAILAAAVLAAALGLAFMQRPRGRTVPVVVPIASNPGAPGGSQNICVDPGKREIPSRNSPSTPGRKRRPVAVLPSFPAPPLSPIEPKRGLDGVAFPAPARVRPAPGPIALSRPGGDLDYLNDDPVRQAPRWVPMRPSEWEELEAKVRRNVRVKDDFVQIPFPRIAANTPRLIVAAVEGYKREAAIVDARLVREVTLQFKGTALSDLCERLRTDSGIHLVAGPSVADEELTLFCEKQPLRDVMRQLSRPFGYTWLRSGSPGDYHYELVQDLRSQLLEEELRNKDRNAALLALEKDLDRYRPYLSLSPDEALARWRTAAPGEKKLFEILAGKGWGLIHMYFRLSPPELAALRAGQRLSFSDGPRGGDRPLPPDLARGVLQSVRFWRVVKGDKGFSSTTDLTDPRGQELTAVPEVKAQLFLDMPQSELGQFRLGGAAGFYVAASGDEDLLAGSSTPLAIGVSPAVLKPENAAANAALAHRLEMHERVTVSFPEKEPGLATKPAGAAPPTSTETSAAGLTGKHLTTADALEALHRATHLPLVADYYTRLYKPEELSVKDRPLFEALNHLGDALHVRWSKDSAWLQFRSTSCFNDRLKEVPNRLLGRWAAARRQHGALSLDDLLEIAQLPDAPLDATSMAEGAKELYGLEEWDLACYKYQRPHLRYLASFSPAQRQEMLGPAGLPFTKMTLPQQRFIASALEFDGRPLESLDELAGACCGWTTRCRAGSNGAIRRAVATPSGSCRWRPGRVAGECPVRWCGSARVRRRWHRCAGWTRSCARRYGRPNGAPTPAWT